MSIVIANRQRTQKINSRLLKQIVLALLAELKIEDAELGIHLVGTGEMARVNWRFLQHEGSTDVITFDHNEADRPLSPMGAGKGRGEGVRVSRAILHGELFVCVDDAVAQAKEFKTTWQSEVVRYIVHGVLHLLGHDDLQPDLRRKMKREENRLVRQLEKAFSLAQL